MKRIEFEIDGLIAQLTGNDDQARVKVRARQVRERYKQVIQAVYRESAPLFLAHTNNVYITDKYGKRTLIVYVEESIFAAELNAQRELIKLKLLESFGEEVEEFEIHVSRSKYKNNHPFSTIDEPEPNGKTGFAPLDSNEESYVSDTVSVVSNEKVRNTLEKAMKANLQWNKAKNRNES